VQKFRAPCTFYLVPFTFKKFSNNLIYRKIWSIKIFHTFYANRQIIDTVEDTG